MPELVRRLCCSARHGKTFDGIWWWSRLHGDGINISSFVSLSPNEYILLMQMKLGVDDVVCLHRQCDPTRHEQHSDSLPFILHSSLLFFKEFRCLMCHPHMIKIVRRFASNRKHIIDTIHNWMRNSFSVCPHSTSAHETQLSIRCDALIERLSVYRCQFNRTVSTKWISNAWVTQCTTKFSHFIRYVRKTSVP